MKNKLQISFIVLTYNSILEELYHTLDTIIAQKDIDFDIIISDDGSKNFEKDKIVNYFENKSFKNFKVLANKVNSGTTLNLFNALKHANGEFIKAISPGDYIYNDIAVSKALNYMKENSYDVIFGKAAYYYKKDSINYITSQMCPFDLDPYKQKNYKKIKNNYLYYGDTILGAAFIVKKQLLEKYLSKIVNKIFLAEDASYMIMIANDIHIDLWDDYLMWYECNTGVSSPNSNGLSKVFLDVKTCYKLIEEERPELKNICKIHYNDIKKHPIYRIFRKLWITKINIKNKINRKKIFKNINKEYLEKITEQITYFEGEKNGN